MGCLAAAISLHLVAFVLAGVSGWRSIEDATPLRPLVISFPFVAFDIAQRNIQSLLFLVVGNICTVGLTGMLMMGGNGYGVSVAARMVGAGIWMFAPLEVVAFCCAGGAAQHISLVVVRWAMGESIGVRAECRRGALVMGASCVGLAVAAVIEAAVILHGGTR